jgi:hypothetical protein
VLVLLLLLEPLEEEDEAGPGKRLAWRFTSLG